MASDSFKLPVDASRDIVVTFYDPALQPLKANTSQSLLRKCLDKAISAKKVKTSSVQWVRPLTTGNTDRLYVRFAAGTDFKKLCEHGDHDHVKIKQTKFYCRFDLAVHGGEF